MTQWTPTGRQRFETVLVICQTCLLSASRRKWHILLPSWAFLLYPKCYKFHRIINWFDTFNDMNFSLVFRVFVLQVELAVQMTCESCADKVRAALQERPGRLKTLKYAPSLFKGVFSTPVISTFV